MPETERTTIVLTEAMAEEIRKAVEAGEYASTSEAVRHGVRMWMDERWNGCGRKSRKGLIVALRSLSSRAHFCSA
jgi:Arc/MetJ-type ribon-helix-helix transcriptional regulator